MVINSEDDVKLTKTLVERVTDDTKVVISQEPRDDWDLYTCPECNQVFLDNNVSQHICGDCLEKLKKKEEEKANPMITRKTWDDFRNNGLLWWVNRLLHMFGWAITYEVDIDGKVTDVYPARVKYRGFGESAETEGFKKLSTYLRDNIVELEKEARE